MSYGAPYDRAACPAFTASHLRRRRYRGPPSRTERYRRPGRDYSTFSPAPRSSRLECSSRSVEDLLACLLGKGRPRARRRWRPRTQTRHKAHPVGFSQRASIWADSPLPAYNMHLMEQQAVKSRPDECPNQPLFPAGWASPPDGLPSRLAEGVTKTVSRKPPEVRLVHHPPAGVICEPAACEIRDDPEVPYVRDGDSEQVAASAKLTEHRPWVLQMFKNVSRDYKVQVPK
jgi:hypothetical protein